MDVAIIMQVTGDDLFRTAGPHGAHGKSPPILPAVGATLVVARFGGALDRPANRPLRSPATGRPQGSPLHHHRSKMNSAKARWYCAGRASDYAQRLSAGRPKVRSRG